jgi:hypothetical protein
LTACLPLGGSAKASAGSDSGSGQAVAGDEDAALEQYKQIMQPLQFVEVEQVSCITISTYWIAKL